MNQPDVTSKDRFLSSRQRYQPIALPEDFSNEEMARNWRIPKPILLLIYSFTHLLGKRFSSSSTST